MTGNERRDRGWVFLRGSLVFILHERVEGIIESVGQLATVVANKCHPMKIYQYMGGGRGRTRYASCDYASCDFDNVTTLPLMNN